MTCVVVFTMFIAVVCIKLSKDWKISDLLLKNIECLASTEGYGVSCNYNGSLDCPYLNVKVLYIVE